MVKVLTCFDWSKCLTIFNNLRLSKFWQALAAGKILSHFRQHQMVKVLTSFDWSKCLTSFDNFRWSNLWHVSTFENIANIFDDCIYMYIFHPPGCAKDEQRGVGRRYSEEANKRSLGLSEQASEEASYSGQASGKGSGWLARPYKGVSLIFPNPVYIHLCWLTDTKTG